MGKLFIKLKSSKFNSKKYFHHDDPSVKDGLYLWYYRLSDTGPFYRLYAANLDAAIQGVIGIYKERPMEIFRHDKAGLL